MYNGRFLSAAEEIEISVGEAIKNAGEAVCEGAKSLCTDKTLRSKITAEHNGTATVILAENAATLEFGTEQSPPSPFLAPSLLSEKNRIIAAVADAIESIGGQ